MEHAGILQLLLCLQVSLFRCTQPAQVALQLQITMGRCNNTITEMLQRSAQGSVSSGRRWQSKGARGDLMEQLETMHQPLEALQQTGSFSGLAQSEGPAENGAGVMQMFATMARKPHWQRGKLGEHACMALLLITAHSRACTMESSIFASIVLRILSHDLT